MLSEAVSKRLYNVKEAGRYLGRSPWTIRRLIREGVLPQVRQGRRVMLDVVDMDRFIEKYKREAIDGNDLSQEEERSSNGTLGETGPYWMKYYSEGRPIQESTRTLDRVEAKRLLKEKEGVVASGLYRGPKIERIRFEDLAALVKQDYQINKRKTLRRVDEYMNHLKTFFRKMRATSITTERIKRTS